jgi:hypothetical protein
MSPYLRTYLPETAAREAAARALDVGCEAAILASQARGGDLSGRRLADQLGVDESHLRHLRGGLAPWHAHRLLQVDEGAFEGIVTALRCERLRIHPPPSVAQEVAASTLARRGNGLVAEILEALADGRVTEEERGRILSAVVGVDVAAQALHHATGGGR